MASSASFGLLPAIWLSKSKRCCVKGRKPRATAFAHELSLARPKDVHLTRTQYKLFGFLVDNVGRVLTHRQLLREVWGPERIEHSHYLRVFMASLRQKLEDDPAQPKHILTETAVGYRLVQELRV